MWFLRKLASLVHLAKREHQDSTPVRACGTYQRLGSQTRPQLHLVLEVPLLGEGRNRYTVPWVALLQQVNDLAHDHKVVTLLRE